MFSGAIFSNVKFDLFTFSAPSARDESGKKRRIKPTTLLNESSPKPLSMSPKSPVGEPKNNPVFTSAPEVESGKFDGASKVEGSVSGPVSEVNAGCKVTAPNHQAPTEPVSTDSCTESVLTRLPYVPKGEPQASSTPCEVGSPPAVDEDKSVSALSEGVRKRLSFSASLTSVASVGEVTANVSTSFDSDLFFPTDMKDLLTHAAVLYVASMEGTVLCKTCFYICPAYLPEQFCSLGVAPANVFF